MNALPGAVSRHSTAHRRPPAHKSVSLRHSPPQQAYSTSRAPSYRPQGTTLSSPNGPASDKANPPSTVSPKIAKKYSSGESSDAGKWFENTNNNAVQSNASFVDNEPPFFLRNSTSSGTPPDGQDLRPAHMLPHSISGPWPPGIMHMGTDGSSTEDFRSVIDDLTVANKRLKQRLRKYEKLYDAHLEDEKLFEVRFHGLPDHKKKELEETLRKFAADLDNNPKSEYPLGSYAPHLDPHKTGSSHTSRFAESGYASMSASGQNSSTARSGQENDRSLMSKSQYNRQQQNVHSYLHDIPAGLLPKHNAPMTDQSRKKMVVRRLEQIFAGKRSAPGSHPQPMQQEEVAQSAAMADRRAKEATGQHSKKEGNREARIMAVRVEDDEISGPPAPESLHVSRPPLVIKEPDPVIGSGSPDQRPTRPLDLDPYRAQVPAENMDYIRHLGFSPPDMLSGATPEDDHGWLYLNLLINMAQLHTINVTPEFVKEAVSERSSKLELSHDGRKIRWRGGHDMTRNSDSSSDQLGGNSPDDLGASPSSRSPTKRIKTGHSGGSSVSILDAQRHARHTARAAKEQEQNKLVYTPIFFHKDESSDEDDFYGFDPSSSNSPFLAQPRGDSSGFGSSAMRSSSSRKKHEDGPIIFYNRAKFCTDLSGDRRGVSVVNPTSYKSIMAHPLGSEPPSKSPANPVSGVGEPRGPLHTTPLDMDPKDVAHTTSSEEEIGFSPEALQSDKGSDSPETMDFEASGLGGVRPEDNFSIKVRRSQVRTEPPSTLIDRKARRSRHYPKKILEALDEYPGPAADVQGKHSPSQPIIKQEILSASRKTLPRSVLPPASFLPFDSTSSGDIDSDLESDVSSSPSTTSSSSGGPATALRFLNISPAHGAAYGGNFELREDEDEDEDEDSEDGSDSDSSVDLLATARAIDPSTIRASEREYDAALAERLAEDIPAGSSAATAGGGSGFTSPASVVDGEVVLKPVTGSGSASTRAKGLKRARTNESIVLALKASKKEKPETK